MYDLYIKVENGQVVDHPTLGGNLLEFYSSIPDNYQPFIRVARPTPTAYQVVSNESTYQQVNGIWTDVWGVRDMTPQEKQDKIDRVIALPHPENWVFDAEICKWKDPKININAPGSQPNVIG